MAYTPNLLLQIPTPGDPAQLNAWGTMENTGRSLVDTAIAGTQPLSIAGSGTTILTSLSGLADQSRAAHYNFTGVLTGASVVLWPQNCGRMFSVANNTTGAFSLTLGANNGSGAAGGTTVVIPQGVTMLVSSDGTNVASRQVGFSANVPMFGFKLTGLAAGSGNGDSLSYGQTAALLLAPLFTGAPTSTSRTGAAGTRNLWQGQDGNVSGVGTVNIPSQITDNLSTQAVIFSNPDRACLVIVEGNDGTNFFSDILNVSSNAVSVISLQDSAGAPAVRTYAIVAFNLALAMASGTYNIHAAAIAVSARS